MARKLSPADTLERLHSAGGAAVKRDLHNAYQKGYNAGRSYASKYPRLLIDLAKSFRSRSLIPLAEWHCGTCIHWTTHHEGAHFGPCDGDFEWSVEGFARPESETRPRLDFKLVVSENFGCVNYRPRPIDHPRAARG